MTPRVDTQARGGRAKSGILGHVTGADWGKMPGMECLDEFTLHRRLAATPGPALVLFTSPTCGTCRVVERRLPEAAPPAISVFKVDVQAAQALARAFDVFHLPALFLFVDGHFHARLDCQVTPTELRRALDAALAEPAQEEP